MYVHMKCVYVCTYVCMYECLCVCINKQHQKNKRALYAIMLKKINQETAH